MKLLLDTQMILWLLADDRRLSQSARDAFVDPANRILFSAVSAWEIAIKCKLGKLPLPAPTQSPEEFVTRHVLQPGVELLDIRLEHVLRTYDLPLHHKDPFDRLLIAQADVEGAALFSADAEFPKYGIMVVS